MSTRPASAPRRWTSSSTVMSATIRSAARPSAATMSCGLLEGVLAAPDHHDVGACLREPDRQRTTEAAPAAGDQRALSLEAEQFLRPHRALSWQRSTGDTVSRGEPGIPCPNRHRGPALRLHPDAAARPAARPCRRDPRVAHDDARTRTRGLRRAGAPVRRGEAARWHGLGHDHPRAPRRPPDPRLPARDRSAAPDLPVPPRRRLDVRRPRIARPPVPPDRGRGRLPGRLPGLSTGAGAPLHGPARRRRRGDPLAGGAWRRARWRLEPPGRGRRQRGRQPERRRHAATPRRGRPACRPPGPDLSGDGALLRHALVPREPARATG